MHPSLGQRATSWQDLQHDDSPVSPSRRVSSYKDLVTRVGPSYGDLVERATPNCPFVSTILDCVLFLHNTLALTVYFLFVSESYERLGWIMANQSPWRAIYPYRDHPLDGILGLLSKHLTHGGWTCKAGKDDERDGKEPLFWPIIMI